MTQIPETGPADRPRRSTLLCQLARSGVLVMALAGVVGCSQDAAEGTDTDQGHDHAGHDHGDHDHDHDGPAHALSDGQDAGDTDGSTTTETTGAPPPEFPGTLPEGWSIVPGERQMRLATFQADTDAGPVEIALTRFPGDVGGVLANINRWRSQVGLGPISDTELEDSITRFESEGFTGYETRIEGAGSVLIAAGVHEQATDQTWFLKANADAESADQVEPELLAFARSIAGG